jgi:GNAT superfamily N-acetyltransferase
MTGSLGQLRPFEGGTVPDAIRAAETADRVAIEEIVRQAYQPWVPIVGGRPLPMDADYAALIADGRVYVTALVGEPAGAAPDGLIVLLPEGDGLLVDNVAVRPSLHGRGIGRRLLAFAEEEARRRGLPAVRLYTHEKMTKNIALYEALGYRHTGRQAVGTGDLLHLRKMLGAPESEPDPPQRPRHPTPTP